MIIRIIRAAAVATLAYHASRTVIKQAKLLVIRAEAKEEMDLLETKMKDLFANKSEAAASVEFQDLIRQYNRWCRVHAKTF